ncbi:xanthine dehydrogenase [Rhodoplanes elegans]|uniref:Xanthine dehydrogenase n=1 Tax=Rhodoplanes elegans TaxID=29408 RepID=A0A327KY74_9BRAD|nr:xanthine dehydrogenase family protein molybdopterin-binding subunit [Rhodoplanes elegans]MBK5958846.1 xanthine dehydrogenase [Rhodoplanes elegans]RAI42122.1 xanthine dehydrogenase [Rhodoplanes elegans]
MSTAAPEPKANMGRPEPRLDARLKVTGEARYPSDMPAGNLAHAVLVTSGIARGRLTDLDTAAARAVPGVVEIFTAENTKALKHLDYVPGGGGPSTSVQELGPEIAHDGQIIAMVVAETLEAAREAAHAVTPAYARENPSATFESNGVTEEPAGKEFPKAGDAEAAFAAADVTIEAAYGTSTQHHNAIELFTTTCLWDGDRLTIHEPSQFVYGLKNAVAKRLDMDPAKVRVVSPFVGGAFGAKAQMTPRTALVAFAAKTLGRPVKLVATRDQGFTIATYRAETRHRIRLGARRDGKIVAYTHEGREVTSRPDAYKVAGVADTVRLYDFGTVATKVSVVHADRNTPGFMRSPPVVPYVYALESAMDELAHKLGMDPVELRRINDVTKDTVSGKPWSSRALMKCYDEAAAAFGWSKRSPAPGSMRDGDWLIGWGCATACYPTHLGATAARVRLLPSGEVRVQVAAHDIGTGAYTVIGQQAAERLGVPLAAVRVELGDSDLPPGPVAGGSNTTASVCSAVIMACDAIREKLVRAASTANDGPLAGRAPGELSFTDGRAVASDGAAESVTDVMKRLGTAALEEYAEYLPPGVPRDGLRQVYGGKAVLTGGPHGDKIMYALGAEFVEVRIHARTREVRVPRAVGAFAGGRIMNPRTAHSQLMGGMIWGIGSALHEATEIDPREARYINDNIAEYLIPVNADVPSIEVIMVPEEDAEVNPAGVKGLGELANVGTAAAIANAVHHATGKRIRDLPIRIEDLLA